MRPLNSSDHTVLPRGPSQYTALVKDDYSNPPRWRRETQGNLTHFSWPQSEDRRRAYMAGNATLFSPAGKVVLAGTPSNSEEPVSLDLDDAWLVRPRKLIRIYDCGDHGDVW